MIRKQPEKEKKSFEHSDMSFKRVSYFPSFLKSYLLLMRVDRPVGILLPLLSAFLGLFGGAFPFFPTIKDIVLFSLGAFIMRSAGCVINDIWDKDFDAKVRRTWMRPLPAKEISLQATLLFLIFLLCLGFLILIQFNTETIILGFVLMFLSILYPLMKRITYWPQIFLGLTFNAGVLMGWASQGNPLNASGFILYGGSILWTLGYDTIYAYQDAEDDLLIGVKSAALRLKIHAKPFLWSVYTGAVLFFYWFGERRGLNFFYKGACFLMWLHFSNQIFKLDIKNPKECLKKFKSNIFAGGILFLGLVLGIIFR